MKYLLLLSCLFTARLASAQQFLQPSAAASHWVDSTFKHLSKKQQIAQLMVLRLSERRGSNVVFFDQQIAADIKKYNIGSICLFQGSPVQQATVINALQQKARTPLMVCIDGETGVGMRFTDSIVKFPDQLTLGAVQNAALAYKMGQAIAAQCKRIGIQVNYAPVVDINNNPNNPVINFRSLGEDKYRVSLLGTQVMKGMQDGGVMACAKHFPGHGDVAVDSHLDLPVINKSITQLDSLELYPFRELISAGVGSVMVAHLYIPAIDSTPNQATSLSYKNVTGLLRNQLGFKGITFTDALEMKGVAKFYPQGEAAAQSLIAGNDMLCLPGDVKGSIKKVRKAVRQGKLSWDDIEAKVKRVLLAKYNLGLDTAQNINTEHLTEDLNAQVNLLKKEVYANAITLLHHHPANTATGAAKKVAYVGIGLKGANHFARLLQQTYNASCFYFDYAQDSAAATRLLGQLQGYDEVIVGLHQYAKYPARNFGISGAATMLMQQLQQQPATVALVFGNPYAVKNLCNAPVLVACYEDDSIMHETALALLKGELQPKGKLPVTVCDNLHYGDGIVAHNWLPEAPAASLGFDTAKLNTIDSVAAVAIAKHATPGCVVLVAKNGKIAFAKGYGSMSYDGKEPVTVETVYDLASVTKISATTVSVMKLYEQGKLDIHQTLGNYLPWLRGSDKAGLTLENVLLHQAGLNAFIPFYRETIDTLTGKPKPGYYAALPDTQYTIRVAENMYMRKDYVDSMFARIRNSKLGAPNKYVYSDNDFILLGKIVEAITGMPLEEYVRVTFYEPLQMESTGFHPRDRIALNVIAPTEKEKFFRRQQLRGDVHDPGAAMFGGVAGHAGLFSNAEDLAKLYQLLLNGGTLNGVQLLKKETIDFFTAYHSNISRRGLGFDKPEKDNATRKEAYPARSVSPLTFGHTGFTGIGVWADPQYNLLYIFFSNRVNPEGGENLRLSQLNIRSNIQDIIYAAMKQ
ncbi:glycoside hydrolase family 3 N-terminal domain-containing protein [Deminuibacter soli]|uniref:beta-N-acetylhexosaminidase n=1 Tax=Deminuibacter soli TaxID=2291815 RepID=A0A3E1NFI0_9BACT|nr:glycoside hydrolase family 3 N-terminal domain-containing protein [Deminuibacter soli]RFM26733.1 serine hydrolase [Deminuibacter soli]